MERKSFFENVKEIKDNLNQYVEKRLTLIALTGLEKAVKALTTAIAIGVVILFLSVFWLFVSAAAAIYVGRLLGSIELGLLAIAVLYLLLAIIFFVFRKQIFGGIIISYLVDVFFKDDDDDKKSDSDK